MFHADRQTGMTKAMAAFRNSAKANRNYFSKQHERGRLHKRRSVLCSKPTGFTGMIYVNVTCMAQGTQKTSLGGPYLRYINRQKAVTAKACRITRSAVSLRPNLNTHSANRPVLMDVTILN